MLRLPDELLSEVLTYFDREDDQDFLRNIVALHSRLLDPARAVLHSTVYFRLLCTTSSSATPEEQQAQGLRFLTWQPTASKLRAEGETREKSNGSFVQSLQLCVEMGEWGTARDPPFHLVVALLEACPNVSEATIDVPWVDDISMNTFMPLARALREHPTIRTVRLGVGTNEPALTRNWMSLLLSSLPSNADSLSLDLSRLEGGFEGPIAFDKAMLGKVSRIQLENISNVATELGDLGPLLAAAKMESFTATRIRESGAMGFVVQSLVAGQDRCHTLLMDQCMMSPGCSTLPFHTLPSITHLTMVDCFWDQPPYAPASYFTDLPINITHLTMVELPAFLDCGPAREVCPPDDLLHCLENETWLPRLVYLSVSFKVIYSRPHDSWVLPGVQLDWPAKGEQ